MFRAAFRRLLAIDDPPERTALAFSIGVFIAFSPLLGLHTILATLIAFVFRFNKVAIYTGTFLNNPPLTLVPIIIASYAVGAFLMGRPLKIPSEGIELLKHPHRERKLLFQRLCLSRSPLCYLLHGEATLCLRGFLNCSLKVNLYLRVLDFSFP